jgi:hypothetical protein
MLKGSFSIAMGVSLAEVEIVVWVWGYVGCCSQQGEGSQRHEEGLVL